MILDRISNKEFEHKSSMLKQNFYSFERYFGDIFFKSYPPSLPENNLLNLGCGPLLYEGWINADDYGFKRTLKESNFRPNWRLDITRPWKCKNDFFDGIFSQHVLEHVNYSDVVFVLKECFRTLKPGCWIRISVPGFKKYLEYYQGQTDSRVSFDVPFKVLAISALTQMHGHKSTWDDLLMCAILSEIGFCNVSPVNYLEGTDGKLIKDQEDKMDESIYFEAQKPL
jgi:predicted SAM-dependent methyltransferase